MEKHEKAKEELEKDYTFKPSINLTSAVIAQENNDGEGKVQDRLY